MLWYKREGDAHDAYDKNRDGRLPKTQPNPEPNPEQAANPRWFDVVIILIFISGIVYQCSTTP